MIDSPEKFAGRPHPGDPTAAESRNTRRRLALGVLVALSLNFAFLSGGAAVANYLTTVFQPYFYPTDTGDKMVYITFDPLPSPSPTASPSP
jgi:hypothetical protein